MCALKRFNVLRMTRLAMFSVSTQACVTTYHQLGTKILNNGEVETDHPVISQCINVHALILGLYMKMLFKCSNTNACFQNMYNFP